MQRFTESGNPCRVYVVRRLLHLDGFTLSGDGSNGNRVPVHGTRSGGECGGSESNGRNVYYSGPRVFRSICASSNLAAQELGLGFWACADLHRADQPLLFTRVYSSTDILVETRAEGVLW